MNDKHILLVEDDETLQALIEKLLVNNNYVVSKAVNIEEAKKLIKVFLFFISFVLIISFALYKELLSKIGTSLFKSALGGLLGSLPLNK